MLFLNITKAYLIHTNIRQIFSKHNATAIIALRIYFKAFPSKKPNKRSSNILKAYNIKSIVVSYTLSGY